MDLPKSLHKLVGKVTVTKEEIVLQCFEMVEKLELVDEDLE